MGIALKKYKMLFKSMAAELIVISHTQIAVESLRVRCDDHLRPRLWRRGEFGKTMMGKPTASPMEERNWPCEICEMR